MGLKCFVLFSFTIGFLTVFGSENRLTQSMGLLVVLGVVVLSFIQLVKEGKKAGEGKKTDLPVDIFDSLNEDFPPFSH